MIELAKLERIARRHTLTAEEAQDVVQDVLVAAVAAGRSLEDPGFPAWAAGAMRRQAAFLARSYGRRRRREATASASGPAITPRFPDAFLDMLPDGLRRFARLVNAGLDRREIAYLLSLSDDALRQRLSALRLRWRRSALAFDAAEEEAVFPLGLIRRAMRRALAGAPGPAVGGHDPDGHLVIISRAASQNAGARQQRLSGQL